MCRYFALLFALFCHCIVTAQGVQDKINMMVEEYVSQNEEANVDAELLYDILFELSESPITINNASSLSELKVKTFDYL